MGNSMAARRANSLCVVFVARLHSSLYPHGQQSCCLLVTPTPQLRQGFVREPFRNWTKWTLQKSPRQLLLQSSVELNRSQAHVLCPLGIIGISVTADISKWEPGPARVVGRPRGSLLFCLCDHICSWEGHKARQDLSNWCLFRSWAYKARRGPVSWSTHPPLLLFMK